MALTYCALFGLDEAERQRRLHMSALGPADAAALEQLRDVLLAGEAASLIARFADALGDWPAFVDALRTEDGRGATAARMLRFVTELPRAVGDARWFDERLRDTLGWARLGIPLSAYVCAMGELQRLLMRVVQDAPVGVDRAVAQAALLKVFVLEVSLAADSYQLAHTDDFRAAVDALHARLTADPLTRVSTREHLLMVLRHRLASVEQAPFCVVLADLDHFKRVNDDHGHLAGDAVLRAVADRVRTALRESDVVGRLGGEEFAIVLEGTTLTGAVALAERVRLKVATEACAYGDLRIPVTLSQGIAQARLGDTVEAIIGRADVALYAAKREGRNRVEVDGGALAPGALAAFPELAAAAERKEA